MRKTAKLPTDKGHTVWEPDGDFGRPERLAAVSNDNPIPAAYRLLTPLTIEDTTLAEGLALLRNAFKQ